MVRAELPFCSFLGGDHFKNPRLLPRLFFNAQRSFEVDVISESFPAGFWSGGDSPRTIRTSPSQQKKRATQICWGKYRHPMSIEPDKVGFCICLFIRNLGIILQIRWDSQRNRNWCSDSYSIFLVEIKSFSVKERGCWSTEEDSSTVPKESHFSEYRKFTQSLHTFFKTCRTCLTISHL